MGRYCEYNGLMHGNWNAVTLDLPKAGQSWNDHNTQYATKEGLARKWCDENTHGRWSVGHTLVTREVDGYTRRVYAKSFLFKGPNDALLFKLTWGGS